MSVTIFALWVPGRPAPQGSKREGAHGQMRESSPYVAAWRAAVKRAVFAEYLALGIAAESLPLFRGPVVVDRCVFHLDTGDRIDSPPDIDKLLRATFDALGAPAPRRTGETPTAYAKRNEGRGARLWEDDGRVVGVNGVEKVQAIDGLTGCELQIHGGAA